MKNKYTFWKLINEYTIKIPIVQRDYAQGRDDKKIKTIRFNFLNTIYEMIKNEKATIDLDFVYGSESQELNDNILIPLDGQQRLTTLFLLHWYLALKDNKLDESVKHILNKFTYETRISSREFCQKLVNADIDLFENNSLGQTIEDSSWFFSSWKKDSTISSMLVMLNDINDKFKETDGFFEKLVDEKNEPITFRFLKLDNFGLTDSLYIKMNARGKSLTEYENFKAKLEVFLEDKIKSKLDNEWTDLFWKYRDENNNIDDKFLNFFQNITLNFYLTNYKRKDKEDVTEINIFDIYKEVYSITENKTLLINILNYLVDNPNGQYTLLFEKFLDNRPSHWDRVRFYSLTLGIKNIQDLVDSMRVTSNLINNRLIQTSDDLINAIKSINQLYIDSESNLLEYMLKSTMKISFFSGNQIIEEKKKIELFKDNENWKKAILQYEKHSYFNGQICFLIILSAGNLGKFIEYGDKCAKLFNKEILEHNDFLFQRALLSKYDYQPEIGSNYTFCVPEEALRTKIDTWRKVLSNKESLVFLRKLLKEINVNTPIDDLKNIIKKSTCNDWKQYFVRDANLIRYCTKRQIRYYSENEIYLLKKTQMNGKHLELYSYVFYIQNIQNETFSPFKKEEYIQSISWDLPTIKLSDWKYQNEEYVLNIEFNHKHNKFNIYINSVAENIFSSVISSYLISQNFSLEDKKYIFKDVSEIDLLNKIKTVCIDLKKI